MYLFIYMLECAASKVCIIVTKMSIQDLGTIVL